MSIETNDFSTRKNYFDAVMTADLPTFVSNNRRPLRDSEAVKQVLKFLLYGQSGDGQREYPDYKGIVFPYLGKQIDESKRQDLIKDIKEGLSRYTTIRLVETNVTRTEDFKGWRIHVTYLNDKDKSLDTIDNFIALD